jgi:hypothetical protein
MTMSIKRIIKHLLAPQWIATRAFPKATLAAVENAVRESESRHRGEIRFAVEAGLNLWLLLHGRTPRNRAIEIFSQLRVWDTAHNSGVLVYVQLVDRKIEIIADRGINSKVKPAEWEAICRRMETAFRGGRYEEGALAGIREITALLAQHFPPGETNPDELPDKPVVL